jgi:hypothetical protein
MLRTPNAASTPSTRTTTFAVRGFPCAGVAVTRATYVRAAMPAGGVHVSSWLPARSSTDFVLSDVSATVDGCSEATPWPVERMSSVTRAGWASVKPMCAVSGRAGR